MKLKVLAVILLGNLVFVSSVSAKINVTSQTVNKAVSRAVDFLKSSQERDGSWKYPGGWDVGNSALVTFALLSAGVTADEPVIQKSLNYLNTKSPPKTYERATMIMMYSALDPQKYRGKIKQMAEELITSQLPNGMWTYARTTARGQVGDNSNTQYAVLGLRFALEAQAIAPPVDAMTRLRNHFDDSQNEDGGWGYVAGRGSSGSMTCAGLASLYIAGRELYRASQRCGQYEEDVALASGLQWLIRNFSVTNNVGMGSHLYYYLYGLERVGIYSGLKYIGGHNWYKEGAEFLLNDQMADGSWKRNTTNTAFALLFLVKGKTPALIGKLKWKGDWNTHIHDAENLTSFVSLQFKQNLSWEAVALDEPLEYLSIFPILLMGGQSEPVLTDAEIEKLRQYIKYGGTLVAVASCGRREFDIGFKKLVQKLFPDRELTRFDQNSLIYRSFFKIRNKRPLYGLRVGCRYGIIYSPTDIAWDWERLLTSSQRDSFQMGTNIVAFITGMMPLEDKLVKRDVNLEQTTSSDKILRGALVIAQIKYPGQWEAEPAAMPKLMQYLSENFGMDVGSQRKVLSLTEGSLYDYPLLYLTGLDDFTLTDTEKSNLKAYLERGGFLFAEPGCGREEFDAPFRNLMKDVFPDKPLKEVPLDDDIFKVPYVIEKVKYRPAALELDPTLSEPRLEAITIDGRYAVVYSRFNLGVALAETYSPECVGVEGEDAFKLATNIVFYTMTH